MDAILLTPGHQFLTRKQLRARLQALLARAQSDLLRFSESFPDADALLAECSRRGLEGIVSKRKDAPYRSGTRSGWIKVKTSKWKAANRRRGEFFSCANWRRRKKSAASAAHRSVGITTHFDMEP